MKYIKLLILCFATLFIVLLGLSLLIPSHIIVSRAINLNHGQDSILNNINDLSKWKNWYPGLENIALEKATEENGKIIAASAGGVKLRIKTYNDSVVNAQMQKREKPVNISWKLIKYNNSDSLTLQSYMDFNLKWYPWEKLSGFLFDKNYGPVMEQSLKNLKNIPY